MLRIMIMLHKQNANFIILTSRDRQSMHRELHVPYLALANLKFLVVLVNDGGGRSRCAGEGEPFMVCCQLNGPLGGHGVTRVEAGGTGNSAEHGKVFESHLRGTILT